jgi:hypothetical protein
MQATEPWQLVMLEAINTNHVGPVKAVRRDRVGVSVRDDNVETV